MGLPLAAQFASHGWHVIAVDVNPAVVDAINAGRSHVGEEPGLAELVARVHAEGRLRATLDAAAAARAADVVVLIVPVMLDADHQPDYRYMDPAVASIAPGVHAGSTVIFETTLPIGDTRRRFAPALERASGLVADRDFFVAFSPERLFSGAVLENLATYPKLVGGIGAASTDRAAAVLRVRARRRGRRDVLVRGRGVQQARGHDVPRRQHRARQRVRPRRRTPSASTSWRSSRPPTASRTATSTSRGSASAATASPSTRTCCSRARPGCASWRPPAR